MKITVSVFLIFIAGAFVGCSGSNPLAGKYSVENSNRFELELTPDGTYVIKELNNAISKGKYQVNGNTITFSPEWQDPVFGTEKKAQTGRIEGNIIVSGNTRYVKQGGSESTTERSGVASNAGKLTNYRAQKALDKWISSKGGSITVVGIQELPQENSARADLKISNLHWSVTAPAAGVTFNRECSSCSGFAVFSHYNDGRWVLTSVQTSQGGESGSWTDLSLEAQ